MAAPSGALSAQLKEQTVNLFTQTYQTDRSNLIISSAPGRVNLIGEHTDYNDGFVMPMALDRETFIVGRPNQSNKYRLVSMNAADAHSHDANNHSANSIIEFDPTSLVARSASGQWHDYFRGVVAQFIKKGHSIPGFDCAIAGNVPLGGGLSSSASLEVATATFVDALLNTKTDGVTKALMCQAAEHEYANVPCGIMDQFISSLGEENHAMLLDCRSQIPRSVPLVDPSITVLIVNSNVKHALGSGEYAKRRAQCEEAVAAIQKFHPEIKALRDATLDQLAEAQSSMSEIAFQRGRHVITECVRTVQAAEALQANNYELMGKLMTHSHVSLKDDYEVSCDELDTLVDIALSQSGVFGSRMTGGGFGGCTVTLVKADAAEKVASTIASQYKERTGKEATILYSKPSQGTRLHQL